MWGRSGAGVIVAMVVGCQAAPEPVEPEPVAPPAVEIAAPAPEPVAEPGPKGATDYDVDGIKLGDRYAEVMAREPYREPCDDDPIDEGARRFMVYGGLPCRGRAFPEGTTVMFYLAFDEAAPFDQPIEAMGWMGGSYFDARADLPVKVGVTVKEAVAALGVPETEMTIQRKGVELVVRRHPGEVHSVARWSRVVGFVLGPMPTDPETEQWRGLVQMYDRYTPKRASTVAACCVALRQRAASALPEHKGAYLAAYGLCQAGRTKGDPDAVKKDVRNMIKEHDAPAACR